MVRKTTPVVDIVVNNLAPILVNILMKYDWCHTKQDLQNIVVDSHHHYTSPPIAKLIVFGFQYEGRGLKPQDQLVMLLVENALHLCSKWRSFHLLLNNGIVLVMTPRNTVR